MKTLTISGSLREDSLNKKLVRAAASIAQELDHETEEADLKGLAIPIYDGDLEEAGKPESVTKLEDMVRSVDAVFISTPEYNHSIPGGLKNVIDWLSRSDSMTGKPVAVMGATPGGFGTILAQNDLKRVLGRLGAKILVQPEVYLSHAGEAFNEDGTLKDEGTRDKLRDLIEKTLQLN